MMLARAEPHQLKITEKGVKAILGGAYPLEKF